MESSYDELYLGQVEKNLGMFFHGALLFLGKKVNEVQEKFLASEIPHSIENGNPNYLCGKSGAEFLRIVFASENIEPAIEQLQKAPFYPQAEYWSGLVLANCQWKTGKTFKEILEKHPLSRILDNYHLMHEADISKMIEMMENT